MTTFQFSEPDPTVRYYIAIRAVNTAGLTSPFSNEIVTTPAPAPLTVMGLSSNRTSPQPVGTGTTFTATASGGITPRQFKWWIDNGTASTVGKQWSTNNTFTWTPTSPSATYVIRVWARNASSTADAPDNPAATLSMTFVITSTGTANQAPTVSAGGDQTVTLSAGASLNGTVTDDGQPTPPGTVTLSWAGVSGPGTVTFANPAAADTTASFSAAGTYVLRLTANDGALSASDTTTIVVNPASAGGVIVTVRVARSADDAEEDATGAVDLTSTDLELIDDSGVQTVGLRFTGVAVPRGATVINAYVQFQVDEASSAAAALIVHGQAADDAAVFTNAARNLSTRPPTGATVAWAPPGWPTVGAAGVAQRTPSLAGVVQEIVNRPGWASGQALALFVTGTGRRTAEAYEGLPAGAPLLHVEYVAGPVGNTMPVVSAGPDRAITLPAGAPLDGAVTDDGQPTPPGTVTLSWTGVSGPGTVTFANPAAADTTASFSAAGTYVLRLTANDGALSASDTTTVVVNPASAESVIVTVRVARSADDAEEEGASAVDLTSTDLELIDDDGVQTVGMRFTGVAVPRGATVINAYVQFQVDEASSAAAALTIHGQAGDNAATFTTTARNLTSRARTGATVAWAPPGWPTVGAAGVAQRTPSLAGVIQEIVNRPGWASGQALALFVTGTGRRTAEAYDGSSAGAPLLYVEYVAGP